METHTSETLETHSCPDSPATRNGSPASSPDRVNSTAGDSPDSDDDFGWDEDLDKEDAQDFDKNLSVGGGLSNLGNTCFLNSVLQCFLHTVPVIKGLQSYNHPSPCEGYMNGFCALCALKELIDVFLASNGNSVSPWKLVNNLNYFSSNFQRYQQEDAHEFLQCFLDKLESCCDDAKLKELMPSESCNLVKQTFGGRLISKLRCCNCGHCSDTYEPLIDLSLEIEDVDSVPAALESFTKVENIGDNETKFTCEKCKEQVSIQKQLLLDEAPSVATFHLKRFKNDGSVVEKIDKHVAFPLELDLLPYAEKDKLSNEDSKYNLYAIVVHNGFSSCSGHYYCFIRAAPDSWYKFDDSKVTRVQEEFVMSQEAYILFYAKQGTLWFSDYIQTQKPIVPESISNTSPKSVLDNVDEISVPPMMNTVSVADVVASPKRFSGTQTPQHIISTTPAIRVATKSLDVCSDSRKMPSPSLLEESSKRKIVDPKQIADLIPITPPRSPSPEIYREDSPENVYSIPRNHLKVVDQDSWKKQFQKKLENDQERKEAFALIKKNMRGSRGQQLMAALRGTQSEGSVNKKRSRIDDDSAAVKGRSSSCHSSFASRSRPVIASSLR